MGELVARKKEEPGDDVITRLIGHAPDGQIAQLSAGLLFAGHEMIEVEGVRISQGDLVLLGIDQANRDEDRFPDPTAFTRREPNPHLTFGHGPRFCIGAPLARVELTEVFSALVGRFATFGLAVGVSELRPRTEQLVGGVAELPVRWTVV
jgi:cytochrome P450